MVKDVPGKIRKEKTIQSMKPDFEREGIIQQRGTGLGCPEVTNGKHQ